MRDLRLGTLAGLSLTAAPSAIVGALLLWLALGAAGFLWLGLSPAEAALGGLLAMGLHWLGETIHQLGHAWAARRAGHPMSGIRYWGVLGGSVYPAGEGDLPGRVHVVRALGGPVFSFIAGLAACALAALLYPLGGLARYLALFAAVDNLLVFMLGALLPLGFTDGSTLLRWWGRR